MKKVTLLTILNKVNLTQVLLALITAYMGYNHYETSSKQDTIIQKTDTSNARQKAWRARWDSMEMKVNHLFEDNLRQDSLLKIR